MQHIHFGTSMPVRRRERPSHRFSGHRNPTRARLPARDRADCSFTLNAGQPPNACSDVRFKHLTCLVSRESGLSSVLSWFREPNLQEPNFSLPPTFYPRRCVRWAPLEALVTQHPDRDRHSSNVLRRRRRINYDARRSSRPTPSLEAFEKHEENQSGAWENSNLSRKSLPVQSLSVAGLFELPRKLPIPIARCDGTAWYLLGAHEQLVTLGTTFTFRSVLARRGARSIDDRAGFCKESEGERTRDANRCGEHEGCRVGTSDVDEPPGHGNAHDPGNLRERIAKSKQHGAVAWSGIEIDRHVPCRGTRERGGRCAQQRQSRGR